MAPKVQAKKKKANMGPKVPKKNRWRRTRPKLALQKLIDEELEEAKREKLAAEREEAQAKKNDDEENKILTAALEGINKALELATKTQDEFLKNIDRRMKKFEKK